MVIKHTILEYKNIFTFTFVQFLLVNILCGGSKTTVQCSNKTHLFLPLHDVSHTHLMVPVLTRWSPSWQETITSKESVPGTGYHQREDDQFLLFYQEDRSWIRTILCMNVSSMEYRSRQSDNFHSLIEVSETRISQDLRDEIWSTSSRHHRNGCRWWWTCVREMCGRSLS